MNPQGRTRRTRRMPRAEGKPHLLIAGVVGGFVVIILLIAAFSGGSAPRPAPEPAPVEAPPPKREARAEDTGAIMFVCSGSARHEDREVLISQCAGCLTRNRFYWDYAASGYRCFPCSRMVERASIKCDCGKVPTRTHIKHK